LAAELHVWNRLGGDSHIGHLAWDLTLCVAALQACDGWIVMVGVTLRWETLIFDSHSFFLLLATELLP
jgi:hypothetical protein